MQDLLLVDAINKAKEMHKAEIIKANRDGVDMAVDKKPFIMGEQYYQETFSTGMSEKPTTLSDKWKEYQDWLNEPPEISDEEIEKAAWENPCLSRQDVYELFDEVFKDKTLEGMFKISASKEIRQFKERLRELAKQKYREQLKTK
jgi:hypothetical protein